MNKPDSISIETLSELTSLLRKARLDVVWTVRCKIGPEWIGGGRAVQVSCNGKRLSGSYCDKLISAIITAASIPNESADSVIAGEGEISIQDEKMILEFEWNDATTIHAKMAMERSNFMAWTPIKQCQRGQE